MANYARTHIGNEGRVELHEVLGLTGAEVSVNNLPAGAGVPFVHAHKETRRSMACSRAQDRPRSTVRISSLRPATGCAFLPLRTASFVPRPTRVSHTFASRSSRAPLVPSRPMTPSCANSRSVCKGPTKPRPLAPCTNLLGKNYLICWPSSRKRCGGAFRRFQEQKPRRLQKVTSKSGC